MGLPQAVFFTREFSRPVLLIFSLMSMLDDCIVWLWGVAETWELETVQPVEDALGKIQITSFVPGVRQVDACSVCLCDFRNRDKIGIPVNCGHHFHKDCIYKWVNLNKNSCPLCRSPIF
ncbi:hypothetical protein AMTRI_Chr03g54150 [Amborella trichopoda]